MDEQSIRDIFPGWRTVGRIGIGSYGTVYEIARDDGIVRERAALKVITIPQNPSEIEALYDEGYDDRSVTATFKTYLDSIVKEYNLMRELNDSVNVVKCDDIRYIQHDDSIGWDIYIRMELLTPLTKALGKMANDAEVIKVGRDICRALVACARRNIVHRDIKPQNIFVSKNGNYKLGDFGIARTIDRTTSATVAGTYDYMAPEVYYGKKYGATVDLYSLGMVLYWLLNERRIAFLKPSDTPPSATEKDEARTRRLRGAPLPPPVHGSEALWRIVQKACAFEPRERYQSAEALLHDLEALPAAPGVSAEPVRKTPAAAPEEDGTVGLFTGKSVKEPDAERQPRKPETGEETVRVTPEPEEKKGKGKWITIVALCAVAALILAAALHFGGKTRKKSSETDPTAGTAATQTQTTQTQTLQIQTKFTELNTERLRDALVVYDQSGSTVNTNAYGAEIAVDQSGTIVAVRRYGDSGQLTVPTGGFVLSGHRGWDSATLSVTGGAVFVENVIHFYEYDPNCRVELDFASDTVRVYAIPGAPEMQYYDVTVRSLLDGNQASAADSCGTFDVYINGVCVTGGAADYTCRWPAGTRYEIRNVRAEQGKEYLGTEKNSNLSGAVSGDTGILLSYATVKMVNGPLTLTAFTGDRYQYKQTPFSSAEASSEAIRSGTRFRADRAIDGDVTTSWQESAAQNGVGETLTAYFDAATEIRLLSIRPGVASGFEENSRPSSLRFEFSDGRSVTYIFPDENNDYLMQLSEPLTTDYVKITILDARTGSKASGTGISEFACYRPLRSGETPDSRPATGNSRYIGYRSFQELLGGFFIQCASFIKEDEAVAYVDGIIERENSLGNSFDVFTSKNSKYYMVCIGPFPDLDTVNYQCELLNTTYNKSETIPKYYY